MDPEMNYTSAFAQLSEIAREIEHESISVDELADKVKLAAELIAFCQNKLRHTETEVGRIIDQMQQGEESAD